MNGPSILCRAACTHCLRPQSTCLCALARPTAHRAEVLVLQHPQEQRQAKNSVALLRLSLAHCKVVVDATWRNSRRMLLEHPCLAALPRPSLEAPVPTRYRAIHAARRVDQVSTLEATVQALAVLEGLSFDGAPLLDAFGRFVTGVAARQRPRAPPGQAQRRQQSLDRRRRDDCR